MKALQRLRIATFNVRNTTDRYHLREPLLVATLKSMQPDLIGFQEVNFQQNQHVVLNTSQHPSHLAPLTIPYLVDGDESFRIDGNCIFSNPVIGTVLGHSTLALSPKRVIQNLRFKATNGSIFSFTNCHLHHVIEDEAIRKQQVEELCHWLDLTDKEHGIPDFTIVVGDFNTTPQELAYHTMISKGFTSAHHNVHGKEPPRTFPSGLQAPTMDMDYYGSEICLDYIWFKKRAEDLTFSCHSCQIHGHEPCPNDPTVYPSDHLALVADFYF